MRGDSDQCSAAAQALARAAHAVASAADQLRSARLPPTWSGTAQERWAALSLQVAVAGDDVVQRLAVAAGALGGHAEALRELQARAARLVAEAAEAGLHLDEDGWIRPVPLTLGPATTSEQELLQQSLLRRQELRAELLARVDALRVDAAAAHERLRRSLLGLQEAPDLPVVLLPAGPPSLWALTPWDAPAIALGAASGGAGALPASAVAPGPLGRARGPVLVLRSVPLVGAVGTGYGVYVDTEVNGMGTGEAVVKNVVVTAAGTVVTGAVIGGAAASLPATAVVAVSVLAGAGVAVGVGRVWDWVAGQEPGRPVPRPPGMQPTRSPAQVPAVPAARPAVPQPSPGPPPQPPSAVHSRAGSPSPTAPPPAPSS